jgi:hypothetical protein
VRLNQFPVTELSTGKLAQTYVEKLRHRAQNQQLWRKGVDAIIEEYKKKEWNERGENKRARFNPAAASQARRRTTIAILVIVIVIVSKRRNY